MKKGIFAVLFIVLTGVMGVAAVCACIQSRRIDVGPDGTDGFYRFRRSFYRHQARVEKAANQKHPFNYSFQSIVHRFDELTYGDVIPNGYEPIIRLSNGYFAFPYPYSHPDESWNNLLDFSDWLKMRDIKFFHLISADKGDDSFGTIPECVPQGYGRMAGEYKAFLDENGIDYLDSKPGLLAENDDFYYWFYKADHHWNVHAGLLMARESAKRLNEIGVKVDTNAVNKVNFTLSVYPDAFLGSQGRALGLKYSDDMEIYYPKDETDFHIVISDWESRGGFDGTLIDRNSLSEKENAYAAFLYGDYPLVNIENYCSDNDTRILVIKMSKANVYCPYFAFTIRHLDVMDVRYYHGSIRSYIEQTRPDAVIACIDVPWEGVGEYLNLK